MLTIQTLPIDRLRPAPYNPRISLERGSPAYRRLERSLDEFGLVQPIVWNEQTGHVVGGHQRLRILENRGVREVEAVVVSLSLEREKALNVALNNSQVGGDWDPGRLIGVLAELDDLPEFDATLTGFDPEDIKDLLLAPEPAPPDEPPDRGDESTVRIVLEAPSDDWDELRPDLDALIASHSLTVHISFPQGRNGQSKES